MDAKLNHCPNCKQNVVPKLQARQGAGCMVFLTCCMVGTMVLMVDAEPPLPVIACTAFWLGGFVSMMVLGHGKRVCPKCGLLRKQMGRAL
jgi:hypothetical protein